MESDLKYLTRFEIQQWHEQIKRIDSVIDATVEAAMPTVASNHNRLPHQLINTCNALLDEAAVVRTYDIANIEVFHGYRHYNKPDRGQIARLTGNPDAYYGILKTNRFGVAHRHFSSDAFNLVLEGEGIFAGDPNDDGVFEHFYHGTKLVAGRELELPLGMAHGHLVKKGSTMWLFAYQHCGFGVGLSCEGDFHQLPGYDTAQFGPDYQ
jgi:hypothetical protein